MRAPDEPSAERAPHPASGGVEPPGLPRLLAFYRDAWDGDGTLVGWRTVAWGLQLVDGSAVTVPAGGPPSATLWPSVAGAADALDAYVDCPSPRHHRAATTSSPGSSDGIAARPARPGVPPARDERGGPPGSGTRAGADAPAGAGAEYQGPAGKGQQRQGPEGQGVDRVAPGGAGAVGRGPEAQDPGGEGA